ncbi:phage replisome organizer N-terminal domain-containing protein [Anaerocolumna sp. AGMB13025]|uniref:phage replisome organizer N-terminal domain-containing protein n=1 Tax=Anaerocolumna sp. AGMB13025 TaxID=3039116 RepID=UPI00241FBF8A|nr:phage replisome organizer N-terminal domain-containing protein [Anaerocolumna sp. AGMB13025]WFR55381.1 phage replisome organizer N-terminal domain-containing protein [Anaerocolumna sp. AGMB13025]
MAEVSWIKLKIDMFDDEKIKLIQALPEGDSLLVIWIRLIALAGKCNAGGFVLIEEDFPYNDEMLSTIFNKPLNTIKLALSTFERFNMVERTMKGIYITNFDKHQNIDGMEKIREQNRIRKQRQREKQQEIELIEDSHFEDSRVTCHADVTPSHAIEEEIEKEKEINNIYSSNEEYSPPLPEQSTDCSQEKIDYARIVESFNHICTDLPKVRALSEERKRKVRTLIKALGKVKVLKDKDIYELLETIFTLAEQSDFLAGRNKPNNWCSFDWLINTTNAIKVIEGNYSNNKGGTPDGRAQPTDRGMDASDEAEKAALEAFRNRGN